MHVSAQKKRSRQRNRPRNKINRIQSTQNELNGIEQVVIEEDFESRWVELSRSNEEIASTAEQDLYEKNEEAIKIIQKIMRDKFLKQSKENNENKTKKEVLVKAGKKSASDNLQQQAIRKSRSKDKITDIITEKNAFITNLQQKVENVLASADTTVLPHTLLGNLQKFFNQDPISDIETSDDEDEYIEYVYKSRQYFVVSLCNLCKSDLCKQQIVPCSRCSITYYCSQEHMKRDYAQHKQLCYALREVAESCGGHIFYKCGEFTPEQFRSYRIVTIKKIEAVVNRPLSANEQEIILFPRICYDMNCREYRFDNLIDCSECGQISSCGKHMQHLEKVHNVWCKPFQLFKQMIIFQTKYGRVDPVLPTKILKDLPVACSQTKHIFNELNFGGIENDCEYASLSQLSTAPLTAWYALKLSTHLSKTGVITIHLIGAEIEFEIDVLHKWELFFLHITPSITELNIVFVGPELNPRNISLEQLKKTKCCRTCRKNTRKVNYYFENCLYHNYCAEKTLLLPNLVCFFNAGLYRSTGFQMEDTWPETIVAAVGFKCPVVVTSYTEYEAPRDLSRFMQESTRNLNVLLPPTINPFASVKPERNFISDEDVPLMFKNYYCFVIE